MKYEIHTLGCKVNIFESDSVAKILDNNGYSRAVDGELPSLFVINTCTVTNKSDSKSRKLIRSLIRRNPEAIVVVMGCYAQVAKDEISSIDGVDIIIGNNEKSDIYEIIEKYKKDNKQLILVSDIMKSKVMSELSTDNFYENTRAFLKIQDGCNNFCSFCIIPYARGLMRSKPKEQVISEVESLVMNGYKEIVLTGIHTGGYGIDLDNYNFTDLIKDILLVEGLFRLRISSIEINQLTDELLEMFKTNDKLAKHLHIPIQSGSDEILKSMRRKYTIEDYKNKIAKIRDLIPNVSITTDIIIGYPTESEENFSESVQTCKDVLFSELHVFPYSKRNGTPAAKLKQVDDNVKKQRVNQFLELSNNLQEEFYKSMIGFVDKIIIENIDGDFAQGKTTNYLNVQIENNNYKNGDIVKIKIIDVVSTLGIGEIV